MRRLSRVRHLTQSERRLLLRALLTVVAIRTALWILPFERLRRAMSFAPSPEAETNSVDGVTWAVRAASRCVPRATCLTQALAGKALLARVGHASRLEIGVAKDESHQFSAHAWLICGDRVVIGGLEVARYSPLIAWEGRA